MRVSWKASAPVAVLFGVAAVGQQIANASQYWLKFGTATELGFFFFLVACIAALKTRDVIERRYPEENEQQDVAS